MVEVLFMVEEDAEGGYVATAAGESIITQAGTIDGLRENIRGAVLCHFDDAARPRAIRLQDMFP
jgi:hypothetical protein